MDMLCGNLVTLPCICIGHGTDIFLSLFHEDQGDITDIVDLYVPAVESGLNLHRAVEIHLLGGILSIEP